MKINDRVYKRYGDNFEADYDSDYEELYVPVTFGFHYRIEIFSNIDINILKLKHPELFKSGNRIRDVLS